MWDIWTLHSLSEKHKERKLLRNPSEHGAHPKREPLALFPRPKRGDAWVWRSTRVSTEDPSPHSRPSPTSPGSDATPHGLQHILSLSQSSGWRVGETHSPGAGSSPQKMPPSALQSHSTRTPSSTSHVAATRSLTSSRPPRRPLLTQRVQGEGHSRQAEPFEEPECAEHGHVHGQRHGQSEDEDEDDGEEQHRPPAEPARGQGHG